MPCLDTYFSNTTQNNGKSRSKILTAGRTQTGDLYSPILAGLPDDVAKLCLALVPRSYLPVIGTVCKKWRTFIQSKEFITIRKEAGKLEEWIYALIGDNEGKGSHWEVLSSIGGENSVLPPMPGSVKAGFGVVVVNGKLLVMAGYSVDIGTECVSSDVYQYDCRLNSWATLAKMKIARFDFACTELNGLVYVIGGYGSDGESLSSAEVYDPEKDEWALIQSLRRPRWGCFACTFSGKVYVMGGRSSFTIGNSKCVDIYTPEDRSWVEMKNGCVMVTAHAVIGKRLFCMEWKNQRKLAVFDLAENTWNKVEVPLNGSSSIGFRFGVLDGKLLLFSMKEEVGYRTLMYDPEAEIGWAWQSTSLKPPGLCLHSVTIKA